MNNQNGLETGMMAGEKPHQFKQFMTYLGARKYDRDKYQVSEREYFNLMKKFNWKLRAKKFDERNSVELIAEHQVQIMDLKRLEFDNYLRINEAIQNNMSVFLAENEANADYFKTGEGVDFGEVIKRMARFQRVVREYLKQNALMKAYFDAGGSGENSNKMGLELELQGEMAAKTEYEPAEGENDFEGTGNGRMQFGLEGFLASEAGNDMDSQQKDDFRKILNEIAGGNGIDVNTAKGFQECVAVWKKDVEELMSCEL